MLYSYMVDFKCIAIIFIVNLDEEREKWQTVAFNNYHCL